MSAAGLLSGLGPVFVGDMLKVPGTAAVGDMMSRLPPPFAAQMFKLTGIGAAL